MISAALGAIAGLYFFFHGFSLLQQRPPLPLCTSSEKPAQSATIAATATFAAKGSETPKHDSHHEVIRLSPADGQHADSASMTQQGKIAAALLKAGISNPVTSSASRTEMAVRLADPLSKEEAVSTPTTDVDASRVLQKSATAPDLSLPSLNGESRGLPSRWKTNLMIWGGPVLTLTCIYILAVRLGWL